jgi:CRISPR-associated protein Csb1
MNEKQAQQVDVKMFDDLVETTDWISGEKSPIALVLFEELEPAEGKDAIIFPPTFAKKVNDLPEHPYCIDVFPQEMINAQGESEFNECLIDSVGAESNYMEECFKDKSFSHLVPQHTITIKGKTANLLDIGHRIADIAVRASDLQAKAVSAMKTLYDENNASEIAKLAPTSLIFGFWNSRGKKESGEYKYKFGRILGSTIKATNVAVVSRRGLYVPAFDEKELEIEEFLKASKVKKKLADLGLANVPIPSSNDEKLPVIRKNGKTIGMHGGIRVFGKIVRRTQINLINLRSLAVTEKGNVKEEETLALRRYLLGLALVAARGQEGYFLREGCLLRQETEKFQKVYSRGKAGNFDWTVEQCLKFANKAAEVFKIGESKKEVEFKLEKILDYVKTADPDEQN